MERHESRKERQEPYMRPRVDTLEVRQLLETVGPAQALSSGADAAALTKATLRPSGSRPSRGAR